MRCEHCSNHQMQRTPSEPSANTPPPTYSTRAGAAPRAPGGARHGGGNRAVNSQPGTGQSTLCGDVKSSYGGAGGWDRRGCAPWAPRSATRQGEEQHRHTERGSHTRRDKGGHSRQGGGAQQGRRGNWNSGNREPEWSRWQSVRMGGSDNKGDGLASQPRRYRVPGQPLLNRHEVGGVSRSPDGLFAQQEWEPIRGRPTVRGKRTYGGRPGQRVEEQGTWAAQKHSEAGDGRPVDRGVWTANTVKRPPQQPAHPQYANYWAPLTRKRHTMPHSAQSQHANYWAPRTRKRHQQEHRPQRPTESSDPTQHAKGRTGDRPGPRKGATTRRNVTQGGHKGARATRRGARDTRGNQKGARNAHVHHAGRWNNWASRTWQRWEAGGRRPGQHAERRSNWASRTRNGAAWSGQPGREGEWAATTVKRPPQQPTQPPVHQLPGPATAATTRQGTPAALTRSTRGEERVTVQGPTKKPQPDNVSRRHRGADSGLRPPLPRQWNLPWPLLRVDNRPVPPPRFSLFVDGNKNRVSQGGEAGGRGG